LQATTLIILQEFKRPRHLAVPRYLLNDFLNILVLIGNSNDTSSSQIEYFDNGTFTKISPDFHTNRIWHLKYLPFKNGYVASASQDSNIVVWDTLTFNSTRKYTDHTSAVYSLDQIDNDTMVSGSYDCTIRIWKISTGVTLQTINASVKVNVVRVFSIEYKQIICGKNGASNNLQIYNYTTGNLTRTLSGHSCNVYSIEMLSEQFMASGGHDGRVIIWDLSSYSIKYNLTGHTSQVNCIKRLSSNLMASGDDNGLIIVWDWLSGERMFNLIGHTNRLELNSLDLYDEQTLISGSFDRTVKFWNITNGELIRSINVDIQIGALAMLKSSEFLKFKLNNLKKVFKNILSLSLTLSLTNICLFFTNHNNFNANIYNTYK
jgi:WD40 repeat protein